MKYDTIFESIINDINAKLDKLESMNLLTLEVDDENNLPENGFINDDSHLLVFVPQYFEDELNDDEEDISYGYEWEFLDIDEEDIY